MVPRVVLLFSGSNIVQADGAAWAAFAVRLLCSGLLGGMRWVASSTVGSVGFTYFRAGYASSQRLNAGMTSLNGSHGRPTMYLSPVRYLEGTTRTEWLRSDQGNAQNACGLL